MTTPSADKAIRITMDKKAVVVELLEAGQMKDRDRFNPDLKSKRKAICKALGVDDATLLSWIDQTKTTALAGNYTPQTYSVPKPEHRVGDLIVRKMDEADADGQSYALDVPGVLTDLLPRVANDLLMKWNDATALCCLDVDYHDGHPAPHESWLRSRITADLAPRPFAWHLSKRGGLHLFYVKSDPFNADELAAAAAIAWRHIDPVGTVELKTGVRGPGDRPVFYSPGNVQDTTALLRGWIDRTPADEQATREWLESEGLEIGKRYDHTKCPINPTPGYASTGDPVVVLETGVFCHRCQGEGRSLGCRRLGYAPFPAIIGGDAAGELGQMVKSMCHWGHANFILTRKYGVQEHLAEKAYGAALKAYHHGTKKVNLIPLVFAKQTKNFTRWEEDWYNFADFKAFTNERLPTLLEMLPVVFEPNEDDVLKPHPASVTLLMQAHNLTEHGLPPVNVVHGYSLTQQHLATTNVAAMYEVFDKTIQGEGGRYLPKYIPASRRNVNEAWGIIEEIVPGVDRNLVTLVMCAVGSAQETQLGMHPKLFVEGASGAAKTTTPQLAAGILGCTVSDFSYVSDELRWGQKMHAAVKGGGMVMLNEMMKDAERAARGRAISVREPFDPLLNVTPEAFANIMYRGPRQYGRLPPFIMTEPSLPLDIRDERQIARRIWHWKVRGLKNWSDTWEKIGLTSVKKIRTLSARVSQACDMIMSDVIDTYFATPMSWDKIAKLHGCQNLAASDEFEDLTPHLRELFRLVCAAPKIENDRLRARYPGYKKITRPMDAGHANVSEEPLYAVYTMFADGRGTEWLKSRRLNEKEWSDILKVDEAVTLDLTDDGSSVFIRFHTGRANAPAKVNEQIVDPSQWEVRT